MATLDTDIQPYIPLVDAEPFGMPSAFVETVVKERLQVVGKYIGREIPVLAPERLWFNPGNVSDIAASNIELKPQVNAVTISRRTVLGDKGVRLAGVCTFYEEWGVGGGSLTWASTPPNGIGDDPELRALEARLDHELLHSVGVGHCDCPNCLMFPNLPTERLIVLATLGRQGLCLVHRQTVDSIADDPDYFRRLPQKQAG